MPLNAFEFTWELPYFLKEFIFMINPQDLVYFLQQGELNVLETFISHYVISAHLVGGLLMTVGLLTRVGALIQLPVLTGALILVHSKEVLFSITQNIELTALVLFLLIITPLLAQEIYPLTIMLLGKNLIERYGLKKL